MSKGNGWVGLDKNMTRELPRDGRKFTKLEAMFSYSVDQDEGISGSIKGYSVLWNWSRNKVRKFISEVRTPQGHSVDTLGTPQGHPIHFIDKALMNRKDTLKTGKGHSKDTQPTPTSNPNPNPNPNLIRNIVDFLNKKTGKNFRANTDKTKRLITARLKEGFTEKDFFQVIETKTKFWRNTDSEKYLRPETLFGPKFDGYLNETAQTTDSRWE